MRYGQRAFLCMVLATLLASVPVRTAEKWQFRLGFETPRKDSQFIAAAHFSKLVKERSDGAITVKLYPDSVLGSGPAMLAAVQEGSLDMYMGGSAYFANLAGQLNLLDIPFLFSDYNHVDTVLTGPLGKELLAELEDCGIKGLAFFENGFRCLTNSQRAVTRAEHVAGLRMRSLDSPMHRATWTRLGAAEVVPLPLAELYPVLAEGRLDGQDHPAGVIFSARLYEVQKFLTVTNHIYSPLILAMAKDVFYTLPVSLRRVLLQCAEEAAVIQKQAARAEMQRQLAEMERFGCRIVRPHEIDIESFRAALGTELTDMYIAEYGDEAGGRWLRAIEQCRKDQAGNDAQLHSTRSMKKIGAPQAEQ